jgi:disulfide bond formation protein DsbB
MNGNRIAALAGAYSLAMIMGALGFQYIGGVLPCEMCHWQRWPFDAAIVTGLGGAGLYAAGVIDRKSVTILAWLSLLLIVATGAIGAYQALVEWRLVPGPASCTGDRFVLGGNLNLNAPVIRCDVAGWRLFGISLAGYNALFSFGAAALGALVLSGRLPLPGMKHEDRTA